MIDARLHARQEVRGVAEAAEIPIGVAAVVAISSINQKGEACHHVDGGCTAAGDRDFVDFVFISVLYSSDWNELYDTISFFLSAVEWNIDLSM